MKTKYLIKILVVCNNQWDGFGQKSYYQQENYSAKTYDSLEEANNALPEVARSTKQYHDEHYRFANDCEYFLKTEEWKEL